MALNISKLLLYIKITTSINLAFFIQAIKKLDIRCVS